MTAAEWPGGDVGDPLRARIVELALAGDQEAKACLLEALPSTLPARVAARFRNIEIRSVACWLRERVPGISDRRIAALLEAAGDALTTRRGLALLPQGASLTREGLIVLRHRLGPLIGPARAWPRQRMLRNILAESVRNKPGWKLPGTRELAQADLELLMPNLLRRTSAPTFSPVVVPTLERALPSTPPSSSSATSLTVDGRKSNWKWGICGKGWHQLPWPTHETSARRPCSAMRSAQMSPLWGRRKPT